VPSICDPRTYELCCCRELIARNFIKRVAVSLKCSVIVGGYVVERPKNDPPKIRKQNYCLKRNNKQRKHVGFWIVTYCVAQSLFVELLMSAAMINGVQITEMSKTKMFTNRASNQRGKEIDFYTFPCVVRWRGDVASLVFVRTFSVFFGRLRMSEFVFS
jgi:hypothetical protein